tara:strand:+ start:1025 stop:1258 length:234 start_codon:yes stop_codon:yes gene_type:complete
MSKKQYKIKYFMNADILAEEIVEAESIDVDKLDLKKHDFPSKNAEYKVNGDIKVIRKSIEDYGKNTNDSTQERTINK